MSNNFNSTPLPKGPLSEELKAELTADLQDYWRFDRKHVEFRREIKTRWGSTEFTRTVDSVAPTLRHSRLPRFCNKPTTFYVTPSGQYYGGCPFIMAACIYKEWFLHYNDEPKIEFGHFLAEPVLITPEGPKTMAEIVQAHKSLHDQGTQLLKRFGQGEEIYTGGFRDLGAGNYKQLPLSKSIILVFDELLDFEADDLRKKISLEALGKAQNVLMVRTGEESHLSAPISFSTIQHLILPIKRDDCVVEGIEVVRVPFSTAVHFIADLQQREEAAFPSQAHVNMDMSLNLPTKYAAPIPSSSAEEWADAMLQEAEKNGVEKDCIAGLFLRILLARKRGEDYVGNEPESFNSRWV